MSHLGFPDTKLQVIFNILLQWTKFDMGPVEPTQSFQQISNYTKQSY